MQLRYLATFALAPACTGPTVPPHVQAGVAIATATGTIRTSHFLKRRICSPYADGFAFRTPLAAPTASLADRLRDVPMGELRLRRPRRAHGHVENMRCVP